MSPVVRGLPVAGSDHEQYCCCAGSFQAQGLACQHAAVLLNGLTLSHYICFMDGTFIGVMVLAWCCWQSTSAILH